MMAEPRTPRAPQDVGLVVIGRTEGERLVRCLASVAGCGAVVYVDSGSTDDSVAAARRAGVRVIAVTTSHDAAALRDADLVTASLASITVSDIDIILNSKQVKE